MISDVLLFNAFDAGLRDAQAHELQDSYQGHPQGSGQYHYHGLSKQFKNATVKTVIGYALDGFPITGPMVTDTNYLTTDDLDECHGITSEIVVDGEKVTTYHYVMTQDFPYSVSCFRGEPVSRQVIPMNQGQSGQASQKTTTSAGAQQQPPIQAINTCSGKSADTTCSFIGGRGETISGNCKTTPNGTVACVPQ